MASHRFNTWGTTPDRTPGIRGDFGTAHGDQLIAILKARFDLVSYATAITGCSLSTPDAKGYRKLEGGHLGGLTVRPDGFFHHSTGIGGDALDFVAYIRHGVTCRGLSPHDFKAIVHEMYAWLDTHSGPAHIASRSIGIPVSLPTSRYANGGASSGVHSVGGSSAMNASSYGLQSGSRLSGGHSASRPPCDRRAMSRTSPIRKSDNGPTDTGAMGIPHESQHPSTVNTSRHERSIPHDRTGGNTKTMQGPTVATASLVDYTAWHAVTTYDYYDEHGTILFSIDRQERIAYFNDGTHRRQKRFLQWHRGPHGERINSLRGVRRVLYELPAVLSAVRRQWLVIVVEGEKNANHLNDLFRHELGTEAVATTSPGGAGKWSVEYTAALRGARVGIIADSDAPGERHAALVASNLQGVAVTVRLLSLSTFFPDAIPHDYPGGLPCGQLLSGEPHGPQDSDGIEKPGATTNQNIAEQTEAHDAG